MVTKKVLKIDWDNETSMGIAGVIALLSYGMFCYWFGFTSYDVDLTELIIGSLVLLIPSALVWSLLHVLFSFFFVPRELVTVKVKKGDD